MAGVPARVEDAGTRAGPAESTLREEVAWNEADLQKTEKMHSVDSGTARRSVQDVNIYRMRAQFQVDLEAARSDFENQLAEMYQRKLDNMTNQLRIVEQEKQHYQDTATTASNNCREISKQLAAVQKINRDREDELSKLFDEYTGYKEQTEQQISEMSRTIQDYQHDVQHQTATNKCREMSQQLAAVQKAYRDQTTELNRLRDEYTTYQQQTEQRTQEMSETIRDHTARHQQVVEEKERLAELCANFTAGFKACDAQKKAEEVRVGNATPVRHSDKNASGQKRKRPDVSSSRLTPTSSRMSSVARSPSPHSETAPTASVSGSRGSDMTRRLGFDAEKDMHTTVTGKKTEPHQVIRNDQSAKNTAHLGYDVLFYCGICQKQFEGAHRHKDAVSHMLGFRPKDGQKSKLYGPCAEWRKGDLDEQDRQDYLLGKYPRRSLRYVKKDPGGDVVEDRYMDWKTEKLKQQGVRGVVILDRDKAEAAAARAVAGGE